MDHPPYAGRDTINTSLNTFKRIDPGLVENAGNKIDKVTKKNSSNNESGWERTRKSYSNYPQRSYWATVQNTFWFTWEVCTQ